MDLAELDRRMAAKREEAKLTTNQMLAQTRKIALEQGMTAAANEFARLLREN